MPQPKRKKSRHVLKHEASSDNAYLFDANDIILCTHGPQLYKAKILQRTIRNTDGTDEAMYMVHYHGWNKQWDEWVQASRCMEHNEVNVAKQKQLDLEQKKEQQAQKQKEKNDKKTKKKNRKRQIQDSEDDTDTDTNALTDNTSSSKRDDTQYWQSQYEQKRRLKKEDLDDLDLNRRIKIHEAKHKNTTHKHSKHSHSHSHSAMAQPRVQDQQNKRQFKEKLKTIIIPTALRNNLVEQYELIHVHQKLIKLPKQNGFTINDILQEALNAERIKLKEKREKMKEDSEGFKAQESMTKILPFVIKGIKGYFRNALQRNLLYNFEKIQYDQITVDKGDACGVYGAEHLVRLFYILPNILFHTRGVDESNFGQIKQCISVVVQFLNKNKAKYLIDYTDLNRLDVCVQTVNEAYIAKAKVKTERYYNDENKSAR
eukprot:144503_1